MPASVLGYRTLVGLRRADHFTKQHANVDADPVKVSPQCTSEEIPESKQRDTTERRGLSSKSAAANRRIAQGRWVARCSVSTGSMGPRGRNDLGQHSFLMVAK